MSKYTVEVQVTTTVAKRYEVLADSAEDAAIIAKAVGRETDSVAAAINEGRVTALPDPVRCSEDEDKIKAFVRTDNQWGIVHWLEY